MTDMDPPAGARKSGPTERYAPRHPLDGSPTSLLQNPVVLPGSCAAGPTVDLFPRVGEHLLHFELVEEIGRGSFARVYLARQECLANRLVVLKVTAVATDEPQKLARLRHTNIVPVYSVHDAGPLQVVCMPYLGRVTLSRVIAHLDAGAGERRPASGRELLSTLFPSRRAGDPGPPGCRARLNPAPEAVVAATAEALDRIGRMSFVEAALWLVAQLAAGLAHAHQRGVLHRDLKPANVLVTDDGVPMILDFNVSADLPRHGAEGRVGGTLPYMAPEHVRAFLGGSDPVAEPSDLYSLGVILYELLTGRMLYRFAHTPRTPAEMEAVLEERKTLPPPPSTLNPSVTPAVDAITLKLLDPIPALRYERADDLRDDLTRQLAHQPLRFAPDTSVRERVVKWRRRNPWLAAGLAAAAAVALLVVLPAVLIVNRSREVRRVAEAALARAEANAVQARRAEAAVGYQTARDDLRAATALLGSRLDPTSLDQGLRLAKDVLGRYRLPDGAGWEGAAGFAYLEPGERAALKAAFAEVLVLMTRAEARLGGYSPDAVAAALRWNELAGEMFPAADRPAVVGRHREELDARRTGRPVPALAAPTLDAVPDADLCFDGLDLALADRFRDALPLLARFTDRRPDHFLAWFARGVCHDSLNQPADAAAAFAVCVSLRSDSPHAHANRGIARLKLRRYADAEADSSRALALRPNWTAALINRGLARHGLGRFADAEADFTAVLANADAPTRVYFLRREARLARKDADGAAADWAEGMRREPADAVSWAARGTQRMGKEPTRAVADFDAALALDPGRRDALLNKAIVLADYLHRPADAVPVFDRLLDLAPDHVEARGGRAMCYARMGKADEARRDADVCLKADVSAFRLYQMAGLHAQLMKVDASGQSRAEALKLLGRAFRAGFADWPMLATDTDLDPIRKDAEFDKVVAAAKQLDGAGR